MGLDMFAFVTDAAEIGNKQVDIELGKNREELAYWRKFNNLHGWMHQLYKRKGGQDPQFNCNTVRLMPEDLDRLESLAKARALPATDGFFFGSQEEFSDSDCQLVLDFISKSREAIAVGKAVVYDSWW